MEIGCRKDGTAHYSTGRVASLEHAIASIEVINVSFDFLGFVDIIHGSPNSAGLNRMPGIRLKENEPFEVAIRRFKRAIEKTGLLTELRSREFYEKPTTERKRKLSAAVKRHHKRLRSQTLPPKMY